MTSEPEPRGAGASTEQHGDDFEETGTFVTDEPPGGDVPAHGSSNAGINATGANRAQGTDEQEEPEGRS
ncbi:hypothetical protein [Actinoplanes aureus]|uniref:Uncharacterized protein n=1 Tax=Actinoplanes aureus TaxID=2792083 RepID=A0A931G3S1_9ACTN|nr:hypothetical protein [Actinoplanes aureus]MBG0564539.1 hypothetical protein [Actinoplanes aureus]